MKYFVVYIWLICLTSIILAADEENIINKTEKFYWGINGGLVYGGPMPTKSTPEYSGSPIFSPFLGIYFNILLSESFTLQPNVIISIRGVNLSGQIKKDTLVETTIGGEVGYIPTFYTANISGLMKLTYIDVPINLAYKFSNSFSGFLGVQGSILLGGSYYSDVHVVVGEGGFYDDIMKHYNMYNEIRTWDCALNIGTAYKITNRLIMKLFGTRSFVPFNKPGTIDTDKMGNMYHTYLGTSITYEL